MTHTTEIISTKQLSDEAVSVRVRCCGNPATDSVLTIYGIQKLSADQLTADINKHHDRVATKCQGMQSGRQLLNAMVAKTKTHEEK
jgi:hypothetical protein